MSKRTLTLIALGAFLLPFLVGGALMIAFPEWSPFGDPVYTDEIPKESPKRTDRRLLERYAGMPIADILAAVKAENEAAAARDPALVPPVPILPAILALLPDAPLPFPDDVAPAKEAELKAFVTNLKSGPEAGPSTPEERWHFNLALAALGVKPGDVPEAIRLEMRPAPESDTFPVRLLPRPVDLKGPLALGSFDGEEGLEIVAGGGSQLYRLGAEGTLVALDGLSGIEPGNRLYPADFDADGDLDLLVIRRRGLPDSLLRNDGAGRFTDETVALGLLAFGDTTAAAWLDYDQDGLLDLLVGSQDRPLELYHQTSAGTFQPVAWDLKLWVPNGIHAFAVADVNGDGYPDLFYGREGANDRLLLSKPADLWNDWRFEEVPLDTRFGPNTEISSATFLDCDHDARPDLLLTTPTPDATSGSVQLFRNEGEGRFADVTQAAGLTLADGVLTAAVADLDLDGYEDLFLGTTALTIDRVFSNQGGTGYREISVTSRGSYLDGTVACIAADLEGNGSSDLLTVNHEGKVRWLEATGSPDRWLRIALPGQPAGTRLSLSVRDRDWVVHTIERRLGEESILTVGIGDADLIERLDVYEATGAEPLKTIEKLDPNRLLVIELPKRPAKRAVVPMKTPPVAGGSSAP